MPGADLSVLQEASVASVGVSALVQESDLGERSVMAESSGVRNTLPTHLSPLWVD